MSMSDDKGDKGDKGGRRTALAWAELACEEASMALQRAEHEADAIRRELREVQARHSAAADILYQRHRDLAAAQEDRHRLQMAADAQARAAATARWEQEQAAFLALNSVPLPTDPLPDLLPPSGGDDDWQ